MSEEPYSAKRVFRRHLRRRKVVLLLLPFVLVVGACSPTGERAPMPGQMVLRAGNGLEPASLDPQKVTGVSELRILTALFEGLVMPDRETLEPVPAAARAWEVSEDGLEYRFFLREELRWSDGEPLIARDFVLAAQRTLHPALGAPFAAQLYPIAGAEAYHQGQSNRFGSVGVRAPEADVLEIRLERPTPFFLSTLTLPCWLPVPSHCFETADSPDPFSPATDWVRPETFVGNGPFMLQEWRINDRIVVARNPRWREADRVALDAIAFFAYADKAAEELAFRSGQLDLTEGLPLNRLDYWRQERQEFLHHAPYLGVYYYILNTRKPPFDDVRVRKALSLAIDRESLTGNLLQGMQEPAYRLVPPEADEAGAIGQPLAENPAHARQLLGEVRAEHPALDQALKSSQRLLFNSSANHRLIAEALQETWRRELGIGITLFNQEWKAYLVTRREGDFDLARAAWIADYPHAHTFLSVFASGSANNYSGWEDPEFDRLLRQASAARTTAERKALYAQAEERLLAAMPVIPIYFYRTAYLVHPSVQGWSRNALDRQYWQDIAIRPVTP